jgi:hypothetical protein
MPNALSRLAVPPLIRARVDATGLSPGVQFERSAGLERRALHYATDSPPNSRSSVSVSRSTANDHRGVIGQLSCTSGRVRPSPCFAGRASRQLALARLRQPLSLIEPSIHRTQRLAPRGNPVRKEHA